MCENGVISAGSQQQRSHREVSFQRYTDQAQSATKHTPMPRTDRSMHSDRPRRPRTPKVGEAYTTDATYYSLSPPSIAHPSRRTPHNSSGVQGWVTTYTCVQCFPPKNAPCMGEHTLTQTLVDPLYHTSKTPKHVPDLIIQRIPFDTGYMPTPHPMARQLPSRTPRLQQHRTIFFSLPLTSLFPPRQCSREMCTAPVVLPPSQQGRLAPSFPQIFFE